MPPTRPFEPKELFRYARLVPPRIIDLELRAQDQSALRNELARNPDKAAWSRKLVQSDRVVETIGDLQYDYFAHLKIKALPVDHLPSRSALADPAAFAAIDVRAERLYRADYENALRSLYAFKLLRREEKAAEVARILNFLEIFPTLHTVTERTAYAPALLKKTAFKKPALEARAVVGALTPDQKRKLDDLRQLTSQIRVVWDARDRLVQARRRTFEGEMRKLAAGEPAAKTAARRKSKAAARTTLQRRHAELVALKESLRSAEASRSIEDVFSARTKDLLPHFGGRSEKQVAAILSEVKTTLGRYDIQPGAACETYEAVVTMAETLAAPLPVEDGSAAFPEYPSLSFDDNIKIIGTADLIRVDETFVEYVDGEISYIENVLAGEVRKREVKKTNYFEEAVETLTERTEDTTDETSTTAKQELASQIETEIASSMNADVNASVNGSGGGTIGVVNFEGGASAGASLGVGVDSRLSTRNSSNFSNEIVSKAVERLKKSSVEKRLTRSYSLMETLNSHEIDNSTGGAVATRSGIYCFLDKRVCISETKYGKRLFLLANVALPGRSLLTAADQRCRLSANEYGEKPVFRLSPADIHPGNYRDLVARYKASGVQTPPPPILTVARTYKTDNTNANVEQQEFKGTKIAEILTPLFEKYKRFLITDTVKLPDGYELREVKVTVIHGQNGVSIPAHLPLKLAGAAVGTSLNLAAGLASGLGVAILVPLGIWQFEYSASPLLHYNTDSSCVTVCIGNETFDSAYYFFQPDVLMRELAEFLNTFAAMGPDLIASIEGKVAKLFADLKTKAEAVPLEFLNMVKKTIDSLVASIKSVLASLKITGDLKKGTLGLSFDALAFSIGDIDALLRKSREGMVDLFEPLRAFINAVLALIKEGLTNALADFLSFLTAMSDATQAFTFYGSAGLRGEVPISLNTVAINPGVTVNLVACVRRTDEALDRWRLETFNVLYQSYLRLLAEYESKQLMGRPSGLTRSPGTMRLEESASLKERILHVLNNYHGRRGNVYDLGRMNLFENGLDWKNMSFRLYNYGPNWGDIVREKDGIFAGTDDRRTAFLKSLWAQVLIPAHPHPHLEKQITRYFENAAFDLEGDLRPGEELAVLYQNLVLERQLIDESPETIPVRTEVIPTDLVRIREDLPSNPTTLCASLTSR